MAKDCVEIHDPISNRDNLTANTDCDHESTSDTDGMEDTVEYRILMAYAKRRRPRKESESSGKDLIAEMMPPSPQTPAKTEEEVKEEKKKEEKKKRTNKAGKRLMKFFRCVRPKTKDNEVLQTPALKPDPDNRCGDFIARVAVDSEDVTEEKRLDEVAGRLTEIADDVPFIRPDLEEDSPGCPEDVEKVIGLLLREAGDKLNDEQELDGAAIVKELFWNYSFFEKTIKALLTKMGLAHSDNLGPQASPKTQIAVTCEAACRLSALDTQPMNRMLAYGAKYLEKHHSSWAKQQGGYEEAFHSDSEDDDVQ